MDPKLFFSDPNPAFQIISDPDPYPDPIRRIQPNYSWRRQEIFFYNAAELILKKIVSKPKYRYVKYFDILNTLKFTKPGGTVIVGGLVILVMLAGYRYGSEIIIYGYGSCK